SLQARWDFALAGGELDADDHLHQLAAAVVEVDELEADAGLDHTRYAGGPLHDALPARVEAQGADLTHLVPRVLDAHEHARLADVAGAGAEELLDGVEAQADLQIDLRARTPPPLIRVVVVSHPSAILHEYRVHRLPQG